MISFEEKVSVLCEIGLGEFAHLNGSLLDHLKGTADILRAWGLRDELIVAGLFHAAYGTVGFDRSVYLKSDRSLVSDIVGSESEAIIYQYCACDRDYVWPQIGVKEQIEFRDRFQNRVNLMSSFELSDFCHLTIANELEIASKSSEFITNHGAELLNLFTRMSRHVNSFAISSFKNVLS